MKQNQLNRFVSTLVATFAFALPAASQAVTAPTPPAFNVGFGVKFGSDYMFRSQTQSNGKPTVQGYVEARLLDWFYAGIFMSTVSYPAHPWGLSDGAAELDYSVGLRHTWDRLTLDAGVTFFTYPGQIRIGALGNGLPTNNMNMWEIAAKPSFAINDTVTVGGMIGYSPDYVGTGSPETYLAANLKIILPNLTSFSDLGWYASGELGYQWLSRTKLNNLFIPDMKLPDFAVWNAGLAVTYKSATLDFRYWGSTLRNGPGRSCQVATSIATACGDRFLVTLSFDTSLSALR